MKYGMTDKELETMQELLTALAPYVIVCGSWARGEERLEESYSSDIDMFIRSRPRDQLDYEISNETYMAEVCEIINTRNLINTSVSVGQIAIEQQRNVPYMFDMSTFFHLPASNGIFYKNIFGVPMLCCIDNPETEWVDCWDNADWDDAAQDVIIKNPIPWKWTPQCANGIRINADIVTPHM